MMSMQMEININHLLSMSKGKTPSKIGGGYIMTLSAVYGNIVYSIVVEVVQIAEVSNCCLWIEVSGCFF